RAGAGRSHQLGQGKARLHRTDRSGSPTQPARRVRLPLSPCPFESESSPMAQPAALPLSPQAEPFTLADQLQACCEQAEALCLGLPAPYPAFTLVFSIT